MHLKEIRDHIVSIKNLKNITGILDKMAIIKLKRNLMYLNNFKDHLSELENIFCLILSEFQIKSPKSLKNFITNHPLTAINPIESILTVFFSSNKGICGSYNQNIFLRVFDFYQKANEENQQVIFYSIGKKSALKLKKKGITVKIVDEIGENIPFLSDEYNSFFDEILLNFKNKKFNQFISFYTDNTNIHELKEDILLPFPIKNYLKKSHSLNESHSLINSKKYVIYNIENNVETILEKTIEEIIKAKIYYFFIKSTISENLIRHLTASRANEKSNELIHDLNVQYNKLRQNKITQEINEIISSCKSILSK